MGQDGGCIGFLSCQCPIKIAYRLEVVWTGETHLAHAVQRSSAVRVEGQNLGVNLRGTVDISALEVQSGQTFRDAWFLRILVVRQSKGRLRKRGIAAAVFDSAHLR